MTTATVMSTAKLPKTVRDTVARNILTNQNWIVINLSSDPPAVVVSGELTRTQWIAAVGAVGHQAKELV